MHKQLLRLFLLMISLFVFRQSSWATGEPSTYFQVFVPPNNDAVQRNACLIVTAIYDSTSFNIIDDNMDGDSDDSKSGILMAGQSYILYIKDNGINDDAQYASGGVLKWDGDYFIVNSNKLVFTSQSTNSDWQHDWVPSTDKKSIGQKFIIYAPQISSSLRDINVFAYEDSTTVTFQKISTSATTQTGLTNVNIENGTTVFTRMLHRGHDLIYKNADGRDVMQTGHTYVLLSNKPITVQYGALYGNERDGGGYVPSSNGSSSGSLFYFGVPYQSAGEQEIRIVSWDDNNAITLERYNNTNGTWVNMKNWTTNKMTAVDWVGNKQTPSQSWSTEFRVTCSAGKRVSVFEGNWFETGSPGTSDMATMVSAENGTSSGTKFLTYMAPPGSENNVKNPFNNLTAFGQQLTHLYIFAKDSSHVTVKDAYSNGSDLSRTYNIAAGRYIDCYLTLNEWKGIYNGTGTSSGPERPYLLVESTNPVSVMNTNFNDNWMCYTGSSLTQSFTATTPEENKENINPGDTTNVKAEIETGTTGITNPEVKVIVQDGLKVTEAYIVDSTTNTSISTGTINEQPDKTVITFPLPSTLNPNSNYWVVTKVYTVCCSNSSLPLSGQVNTTIETIITGVIGGQIQQAVATQAMTINQNYAEKMLFSAFSDNVLTKDTMDSWTASWVDLNNDGWDDVFITDKRSNKPNKIYMNNHSGGFTAGQNLNSYQHLASNVANSWADIDNDGDVDGLISSNTQKPNIFYLNNGGTLSKVMNLPFNMDIAYYHGASFADYDNDGRVDLFLSNYFPTKYNELYHNDGNNTWTKIQNSVVTTDANQSIGQTWADYDGDGYQDLFVPNGKGYKNALFHNKGNGTFEKVDNAVTSEGGQSVGSTWGDYDNDGDLDLFVTNSSGAGNFLYRNDGAGTFTKITNSILTLGGKSHGCSFADIDNDGDLDLYVTNDVSWKYLFRNDGGGNWTRIKNTLIACNYGNSMGHAWSDYDHDGDLDLIVAKHGTGNVGQTNTLFTNNGNTNKWIEIKLVGTVSNTAAIGAKVCIKTAAGWQMREVNSQSGLGGQSSLWQHFGLLSASTIDSIIVKWPSGIRQVLTSQAANQRLTITEPLGSPYKGAVYNDANGNCTRDAGEGLLPRATVKVTTTNAKYYTNSNGRFTANLPNGSYTLKVDAGAGLAPSCTQGVAVTVTGAQAAGDTLFIPASITCNSTDMNLVMGGTAIRKNNWINTFTILATNNGRATASNTVLHYRVPSTILQSTFSPAYTSSSTVTVNGKSYKQYNWSLPSLDPFAGQTITFKQSTAAAVAIGDTVDVSAWVDGMSADCNAADNSISQLYKVAGAIDPNDMQVAPVGYGAQGYIKPDQLLTYTIRFQNIGNMTANAVSVTDILPSGLDMNTFQMVAASHADMNIRMSDNKAVFSWDNIALPDSSSDEEKSQGYIIFSVSPRKGITPGTKLENSASITFDDAEPLPTNTVLNTIQSKDMELSMIDVVIYPNPVNDVMQISLKHRMGIYTNKTVKRVRLITQSGIIAMEHDFLGDEERSINLPQELRGFYLVEVTDNDGCRYNSKVFIRAGQ